MSWTYDEIGATAGALPPGYRHLRVRHRLGPGGPDDLARVGEALLTWRVHAAARVRVDVSAPRAASGVDVVTRLGVGRLSLYEPCRVVRVVEDGRRVGFSYGTLPGHLFRGEEAFEIVLDGEQLWFEVVAFSRPELWWVSPVWPVVPVTQRLYLRLLARGARAVLR